MELPAMLAVGIGAVELTLFPAALAFLGYSAGRQQDNQTSPLSKRRSLFLKACAVIAVIGLVLKDSLKDPDNFPSDVAIGVISATWLISLFHTPYKAGEWLAWHHSQKVANIVKQ